MKTKLPLSFIILHSSFCLFLHAQGTSFTYQGRLNDGASPATGIYDLRFTIYDSTNQPGTIVAGPLTNSSTGVSNGLFTVTLDFGGGVFDGSGRWLDIGVRTNTSGAFIPLSSRQKFTATPYAITAGNVVSGGLAAGTYGNAINLSNSANTFNGSFTGNGGGLSNVNALTFGGLASSNFWKQGGNNPSPSPLLGTIDAQPLTLIAANRRVFQLQTASRTFITTTIAPNLLGGSEANVISNGVIGATISGGGEVLQSIGTFYNPNIISDDFGVIGGGMNNFVGNPNGDFTDAFASTIAGGLGNTVQASYAITGGGSNNTIQAASTAATIGGGQGNFIQNNSRNATIGGGQFNNIGTNAFAAAIGGGQGNLIQSNSSWCTVGGGNRNISGGNSSVVGGGFFNLAGDTGSTVGGGGANASSAQYATVGGGSFNTAGGGYATVGGGTGNSSGGAFATVSGGINNSATVDGGSIGGGVLNAVNQVNATVGGGFGNTVNADGGTIAGGVSSAIQTGADQSSIGGGTANLIDSAASRSTISGGSNNVIEAASIAAAIGGGRNNVIQTNSPDATISGGEQNNIGANTIATTIGGGLLNFSSDSFGTIGGGGANGNMGFAGTIAGGYFNTNTGYAGTISGGEQNVGSGFSATVSGGRFNTAGGAYAVVAGGYFNSATGNGSFAAGSQARANHPGSFVWADSQLADFASTTNDQFNIRAQGGVRLNTDTSLLFGSQTRQMLNLWDVQYGIGIQAATEYFRSASDFSWFKSGVHSDGTHDPGAGGTEMMRLDASGNLNVRGNVVANSLILTSDRDAKQNFEPVDCREVLAEVIALPVARWNYRTETSTRHIGPMAQDFYAAFNVGADDKHIAVVDEGGVALAALQGLNRKVDSENATLREELKQKQTEIAGLKQRLDALEKFVRRQTSN